MAPITTPDSKHKSGFTFMTPVRRILFRLEWSKSSRRRRSKTLPREMAPSLDSVSERSIQHSPSFDPLTSPLTSPLSARPRRSTASDTLPPPAPPPTPKSRIAIQQEDLTLDAIVVTTLSDYPFGCHEDLLRMSREELINVASALNERLPASWQIPVGCEIADAAVRSSIEVLVGIRPPVPMAPKATKSGQTFAMDMNLELSEEDVQLDGQGRGESRAEMHYDRRVYGTFSPPSSPLVLREQRRKTSGKSTAANVTAGAGAGAEETPVDLLSIGCISPRRFLDRLDEEEEPISSEDEAHERYLEYRHEGGEDNGANPHIAKRRRMSSDGRWTPVTFIQSVHPRFETPCASEQIITVGAKVASTPHRLPGAKYRFIVPRKPVKRPFPECGDSEGTGEDGSDLDSQFGSPPLPPTSPATSFFR